VNNASLLDGGGALHELDVPRVERIIAVNLNGYVWGCAAAVRAFVRGRSAGAIVNISSVHGRAGYSGYCAYDPAKGGVDALTRYVAVEYGPVGIRANAIAPGGVLTEGARQFIDESSDPERMLREIEEQSPLRKIAAPGEIAAVAAFLLSLEASFLTGQSIAVDGGLTATCMPFALDRSLAEAYGL
jgi:NAD(P)-dependent dehydrogenase (short-subunit alcohol dehydrogenase family)